MLAFGQRCNLFRSDDGGDSWQQVDTGSERSLAGGAFVGTSYVVLVGAVGTLLVSADGGMTFSAHNWGGRQGLSAVASSGNATVVVGQGGVHPVSPFGGAQ